MLRSLIEVRRLSLNRQLTIYKPIRALLGSVGPGATTGTRRYRDTAVQDPGGDEDGEGGKGRKLESFKDLLKTPPPSPPLSVPRFRVHDLLSLVQLRKKPHESPAGKAVPNPNWRIMPLFIGLLSAGRRQVIALPTEKIYCSFIPLRF